RAIALLLGGSLLLATTVLADDKVHRAEVAKAGAADMEAGAKLYKTHCAACHQANGSGLSGAFPPLADNPHLADDPLYTVTTILNGKQGELEVKGVTYNSVMPPMGYLADNDIAQIANY